VITTWSSVLSWTTSESWMSSKPYVGTFVSFQITQATGRVYQRSLRRSTL
jgi:hypothetical protein